jgi:hypothetical protein
LSVILAQTLAQDGAKIERKMPRDAPYATPPCPRPAAHARPCRLQPPARSARASADRVRKQHQQPRHGAGHAIDDHRARREESTDAYEFSYAWPAAADALPALRAQLAADEAKTRATLIHDAAQGQQEAAKDKYPFHPYAHWQEWQVVTDLPDWLSLSSLVGTDSGGAHPNYAYAAILWDKRAGQQRQALDLFTARAGAGRGDPRRFLQGAGRAARQKRGGQASLGGDSGFDACIDPGANPDPRLAQPQDLRPHRLPDRTLRSRALCRGQL